MRVLTMDDNTKKIDHSFKTRIKSSKTLIKFKDFL